MSSASVAVKRLCRHGRSVHDGLMQYRRSALQRRCSHRICPLAVCIRCVSGVGQGTTPSPHHPPRTPPPVNLVTEAVTLTTAATVSGKTQPLGEFKRRCRFAGPAETSPPSPTSQYNTKPPIGWRRAAGKEALPFQPATVLPGRGGQSVKEVSPVQRSSH